jgi:hypothetical protein
MVRFGLHRAVCAPCDMEKQQALLCSCVPAPASEVL